VRYVSIGEYCLIIKSEHFTGIRRAWIAGGGSSGEWRVESGEWRVESGEWRVESGEWRVESGEWRGERGEGRVNN
jgi:hypothetical protein